MGDLIKITGMWENKTKDGEIYLNGYLGESKIVCFKNKYKEEGDNRPSWNMFVTQKEKTSLYEAKQDKNNTEKGGFVDDDIPF